MNIGLNENNLQQTPAAKNRYNKTIKLVWTGL